ncbi:MAG: Mur ligase family protein, partial [Chitinophagaceae bacterium]
MSYLISHIAHITNASAAIVTDTKIEHLLLDSRKIYSPATSLFVAIKGVRRDGHQFIPELYKRGVRNFIISQNIDTGTYPEANFLLVKDSLAALQQLAAHHRQQFNIPVIGITGSNGKTIIKEWLYQLLQDDFTIVRSPKSYNSQIGVPLSVWQMNEHHTLAIFEAGISRPGEMEKLASIIQPTIGVLTSIGEAHSEGFAESEQKFLEKIKLFKNADWIYCHSKHDPHRKIKDLFKGVVVYCGTEPANDIQVLSIKKGKESTHISVRIKQPFKEPLQEYSFSFEIPFTDNASIDNALLCLGVVLSCQPWTSPDIASVVKK